MTHLLTEYFKLKLATEKQDPKNHSHWVELIAIKDDVLYFQGHISGNPHCHERFDRLFEVGLVKVRLLKKHKTPIEVYKTAFEQFTKELNKVKFVCIQSYNHTFSQGVVNGYTVEGFHFFKQDDTYCLESLNKYEYLVKCERTFEIIRVHKDKFDNFLKQK